MPHSPPLRDRRSPRERVAVVLSVVVVVLLVLSAVAGVVLGLRGGSDRSKDSGSAGPAPTPRAGRAMPSSPARLSRFYGQKLAWSRCGRFECSRLTVPLDYAHPAGRTIRLAVLRVPAGDPAHRVGELLVNPGGPGEPGTSFVTAGAQQFGADLARYYDLVGFDPRGVGKSAPLVCGDTAAKDHLLSLDPDPDSLAEARAVDAQYRQYGAGCLARDAGLTRHISTAEAAKDMDVLRAALDQPRLDYYGASYGTFLGATYADLFPRHVGRMVLDGALDPSLSLKDATLAQAHGFEVALDAYLRHCLSQGHCFLGRTLGEATARVRQLLDRIEAHPLPTASGRTLTASTAVYGIWLPLYVSQLWPDLDIALKQAMSGSGTGLLILSDEYNQRGPRGFVNNSLDALMAVNCLDHDDYVPVDRVSSLVPEFEKASPTFGRIFAFSLSNCDHWPVQTGQRTHALHAPGAPPIVVVGTTRDPATPYAWAKALASQLDSGVLVSRDGDGHTGFRQGNSCVDHAVQDYLVRGVIPRDGLSC